MTFFFSCSCSCSDFSSFSCFISYSCFMNTSLHFAFPILFLFHAYYIWNSIYLYSMMLMYSHIIHVYLSLNESIFLRNWNQSNRIIQNKVMTFSCQLFNLLITLGTVCITHFFGVLTSYLTLDLCTHLKLRC